MASHTAAIKALFSACNALQGNVLSELDFSASIHQKAITQQLHQTQLADGAVVQEKIDEIPILLSDVLSLDALSALQDFQVKKLKKILLNYLRFAMLRRELQIETEEDLLIRVRQTKTLKALKALKQGQVIQLGKQKYRMPPLQNRWESAQTRLDQENHAYANETRKLSSDSKTRNEFNRLVEEHEQLLQRKRWSDWLAQGFTVVIGLAVGLIAAVAIMLILPHLSLALFIPVFCAFALAGSLTEGLVYHRYVKKFFRHLLVRGFFEDIDRNIVKQQKGKRIALVMDSNLAAQAILRNHSTERFLKRSAAIILGVFAVIAGIGFAGLTFSHVVTLLALVGITSGPLIIIFPWIAAGLGGLVFAFVMYEMLHRIIRKDIWAKIKNELVELFIHPNWGKASLDERAWHVTKCILKGIGLIVVLGIALTATLFTLNEWLSSGIVFLQGAIGIGGALASKLAIAMTTILLGLNAWFSVENSLETVREFCSISWQAFKDNLSDIVQHPSKLLTLLVNSIAFIVHVAGVGAVAVQGANASPGSNPMKPILAGTLGITAESLVDLHAITPDSQDHEHHCDHGHDHDVAGVLGAQFHKVFHHHNPMKETKDSIILISPKPSK